MSLGIHMDGGIKMFEFVAGVIALVVMAAFVVGLWFAVIWMNSAQCTAKWEDKFSPQYDWVSGCTIVVDGTRIPSANYRVL
jgi:hypothetical protein